MSKTKMILNNTMLENITKVLSIIWSKKSVESKTNFPISIMYNNEHIYLFFLLAQQIKFQYITHTAYN